MTDKPTQAQIEAAAKAIRQVLFEVGVDPVEGLAKAALTAAAEVGEQNIVLDKTGTYWDKRFPNELIDHTIERCAQVAEEMEALGYERIAAAIRALKEGG